MEAIKERSNTWSAVRRRVLEGLETVGVAVALALLIRTLAVQAFYIPSGSMRPTLEPGDYILVNRLVYRFHPPRRGDIIVFRYPRDENWDFVKRVIGVPGDLVEEREGRVWVNGARTAEPYAMHTGDGAGPAMNMAPRRIPAGQFFVLGDNRDVSLDSRFWGTVNVHEVIGKAVLVYWSRGKHWWDVRWERIGRWLPQGYIATQGGPEGVGDRWATSNPRN